MQNTRLLAGALAGTALGAALAACRPGAAAVNHSSTGRSSGMSSPVDAAAPSVGMRGKGRYLMQPMPTGTVSISPTPAGQLQARVDMFGLTPGSAHQVSIDGPFGQPVAFPTLTANSAGQADTTLTSLSPVTGPPRPGRFVIRLGDAPGDPLAAEPIAEAMLPPHLAPGRTFALHARTVGPNGVQYGRPSGRATLSYDPATQTLTVTVTAHGLNPGPHAAHIHLGSCQNQGPVKYMLADLTADSRGNIINQTRTVTGVPSIAGAAGWYLNLHQGGMNQILADRTPTLHFRPLLCTNISSIATAAAPSPISIDQPIHR